MLVNLEILWQYIRNIPISCEFQVRNCYVYEVIKKGIESNFYNGGNKKICKDYQTARNVIQNTLMKMEVFLFVQSVLMSGL
ncbi:hypothetical protein EMIT019CA3_10253 [Bacillus pseudomycoides]